MQAAANTDVLLDIPPDINWNKFLVSSVNEMDWKNSIFTSLRAKSKYRSKPLLHATPIQSGMWPVLTCVESAVAISSSNTGKSYGWIIPMLNQLMKNEYAELPDGKNPRCVVLVDYQQEVLKIFEMMSDFVSAAGSEVQITYIVDGLKDLDVAVSLLNGCDILIITPPRLFQLLFSFDSEENLQFINLIRCCHLVIENAHQSLEIFPVEIKAIMQEFLQPQDARMPSKPHLFRKRPFQQVVVISEKWTPFLEDFVAIYLSNTAVVVLSDMAEGMIYSGATMQSSLVTSLHQKVDFVEDICREFREKKKIIFCKDTESGNAVKNGLLSRGENPTFLHEFDCDIFSKHSKIKRFADEKDEKLIIITDGLFLGCLEEFKQCLTGDILIHYDLPETDSSIFNYRFTVMRSHMVKHKKSGEKKTDREDKNNCFILISPEDTRQMRSIRSLIRRSGSKISKDLRQFMKNALKERWRRQAEDQVPLCRNLITTGFCRESEDDCQDCHELHPNESVTWSNAVEEDEIQFVITKVESPVSFWVQIKDPDSAQEILHLQMAMFYSKQENRCVIDQKDIAYGLSVAVGELSDLFRRGRITKLIKSSYGTDNTVEEVEVQLLDTGDTKIAFTSNIYRLPVEFSGHPPMAKYVVLSGFKPQDLDKDWNRAITEEIDLNMRPIQINEDDDDKFVCRGRVLLRTANITWIDRCQLWKFKSGVWCCAYCIGQKLIDQRVAVRNPSHFIAIRKLAEDMGLKTSLHLKRVSMKSDIGKFSNLTEMSLQVYMTECLSSGLFFLVRLDACVKERIEAELSNYMSSQPNRIRLTLGDYVLLKPVQDEPVWERGRIIKVKKDPFDDNEDCKLLVYLLDLGEVICVKYYHVIHLPERFLRMYPYQAVPCKLSQIDYTQGHWSTNSSDELFEFSRDDSDQPCVLYCSVQQDEPETCSDAAVDHILQGVIPSPTYVNLFNADGINIADLLVGKDLANRTGNVLQMQDDQSEVEPEGNDDSFDEKDDSPEVDDGLLKTFEDCVNIPDDCLENEDCEIEDDNLVEAKIDLEKNDIKKAPTCNKEEKILPLSLKPLMIDPEMPSLSISASMPHERKLPLLHWTQTEETLSITAQYYLMRDLRTDQVYIKADPNNFLIEVLEVESSGERDVYICHRTPLLKLKDQISPNTLQVTIKGRSIYITIRKRLAGLWSNLTALKYSWIHYKIDDSLLRDDEETVEENKGCRDSRTENFSKVYPEDWFDDDLPQDEFNDEYMNQKVVDHIQGLETGNWAG